MNDEEKVREQVEESELQDELVETRSQNHKRAKGIKVAIIGLTTVVGLGIGAGIYVNSEETTEDLKVEESSLGVKESSSKEKVSEEIGSNGENESTVESVIEEPIVSETSGSGVDSVTNPDSSVSTDNPIPEDVYAPTNEETLQAFLDGKEISFQESGLFVSIETDSSVRLDIDMDYPVGVAMYNTFDTARTTGDTSNWVNLKKFYDAYSSEAYELSATPYVFNVYDPYTNDLVYSTSMGQEVVDNVSKN